LSKKEIEIMLLSEKSQLKPNVIQTNNTVDREDESVSE
jgi:hypothetical protein